jgi:putative membrane protein
MLLELASTVRSLFGLTSIPWLFVVFREGIDPRRVGLLFFGVLVIVAVSGAWSLLSWRATVYGIRGNAFYFKRGVLGRNERTVPLDHIQSVDVVQGVVQRLFNVVEVRIETAGGGASARGGADVSLPAVSRPVALELQRDLAPVPRDRVALATPAGGPARAEAARPEAPRPVLIRRLGPGRLLFAGATSGQIGVILPLIATASQLFDNVLTPEFVVRYARDQGWLPNSVAVAGAIAVAVLLLAWLVAIAGTVLTYAGFTLSREGDTLRIRRGLLERREVTIPINRIQAVQTVENILRQPFGMVLVRMESVGYGPDAGVSTTLFPLLSREEVLPFLQAAAPEFAVSPPLRPLPRRALRRYVVRSALPLLLLAVPAVFLLVRRGLPELALVPLALVALAGAYGWARYRGVGWAVTGDHLVVRSRRLTRTLVIAPRRRLQSRSFIQSPFQRRVRLATLEVRVGRGSAYDVVDLDAAAAREALLWLRPSTAPPHR